jgi:thioredoxin 1
VDQQLRFSSQTKAFLLCSTAAATLASCSNAAKQDTAKGEPELLNDTTAYHAIYDSEKPVVVEFCSQWSDVSKQMAPLIKEFAEEFKDINFVRVDTDKSPQTMQMFEVDTIPTLCMVSKKCKHGKSLTGLHDKNEIGIFIRESYAECHN